MARGTGVCPAFVLRSVAYTLPPADAPERLRKAEEAFTPTHLHTARSSPLAPFSPSLSIGVMSGCVVGVTAGWIVGVDVRTSRMPFAHQGLRAAAPMCGVVVGAAYGSGIQVTLGYRIPAGGEIFKQLWGGFGRNKDNVARSVGSAGAMNSKKVLDWCGRQFGSFVGSVKARMPHRGKANTAKNEIDTEKEYALVVGKPSAVTIVPSKQ